MQHLAASGLFARFNSFPWLAERTILLAKHGSHAYGTALPTSDLDIKGVAIPPVEYFHGYLWKFEQAESYDPDLVVYDIRKFLKLAADCNPNIIEVLWADPGDYLQVTPAGHELLAARHLFLSRKAKHTFSGYAVSQLKRIKTHRQWLLDPPGDKPTRGDFDLPDSSFISPDDRAAAEAAVQKQIDSWGIDLEPLERPARIALEGRIAATLAEMQIAADEQWNAAGRVLGFSENFIDALGRERRYRAALRNWQQYQEWKANRNPERAALEAQHGYDCKHAMHLVRLLRMCREILTTGEVLVKRPDAEELLAIRGGAWDYDRLVGWAAEEDATLTELAKGSPLPHSPNRRGLDVLCIRLVESSLSTEGRP
jgi:predicted nucleotidyltransferase